MVHTVIFDLDGTLIDTEKYFKVFWRQAAAHFGYEMSEEQALSLRSLGRPFAPALLRKWFGENFDYYAVREYRRQIMAVHLQKAGLERKPGAAECLKQLKEAGYRIALATATPPDRARAQLAEVGLDRFFDEIVSASQVERGKPAPDVYLFACEKMGVDPSVAVAVEDSPNGVRSASDAGCVTVMVPDLTQPDEELYSRIFAKADSLADVPEIIERINS